VLLGAVGGGLSVAQADDRPDTVVVNEPAQRVKAQLPAAIKDALAHLAEVAHFLLLSEREPGRPRDQNQDDDGPHEVAEQTGHDQGLLAWTISSRWILPPSSLAGKTTSPDAHRGLGRSAQPAQHSLVQAPAQARQPVILRRRGWAGVRQVR